MEKLRYESMDRYECHYIWDTKVFYEPIYSPLPGVRRDFREFTRSHQPNQRQARRNRRRSR